MAAKKTPARRQRTPHVEVSLTRHAAQKIKPYAMFAGGVVAILALFGTIWTGWVTLGGPQPVSTRVLDEFKSEVGKKIDTTETKVILHSDKNTATVSGAVEKLTRSVLRSQIENLEAQEASLVWSQRPQLIVSAASIEKQLQERQGDQWLMQRKGEVDNALRTLDSRIADTRERLRKLKEQL